MEMTLVNCENYTKGLVCSILNEDGSKNKDKKLFFFEIDTHESEIRNKILSVYHKNNLDVIFHKTKMGIHFLSPTLITLEKWKNCHNELLEINIKCPQICLRIMGNKYPNEYEYFYKAVSIVNGNNLNNNVKSVCLLLNKIFDFEPKLLGSVSGDFVKVSYLPKREK